MMDDKRLDELLDDAARSYRVPPAPPLDAIWSRVEAEAFAPAVTRRTGPSWRWVGMAAAASLVIGVALGRVSTRGNAPLLADATVTSTSVQRLAAAPYQRTTEEFLGRTALLLAALPKNGSGTSTPSLLPEQAAQLLTTVRLLLDSPVGGDARMKSLLQDLELVLAQVSRLHPQRENIDLTLITQALEERDVVPRIRSAVTDLGVSDY